MVLELRGTVGQKDILALGKGGWYRRHPMLDDSKIGLQSPPIVHVHLVFSLPVKGIAL